MANIFYKIRKLLIEDVSFKNYLKYAIGEIILLVIGIILALQISNWNNSRKDNQREKEYLNNIKRDLTEQLVNIDKQIKFELNQLDNAEAVLNALDNNKPLRDSLLNKLIFLAERRTFVPNDPTFQDLKSTGNLNLIRNFVLRDNLTRYYQSLALGVSIVGQNNTHFIDELFNQNLINNSFINFSRIANFNKLFGFKVFEVSEKTQNKIDNVVRSNLAGNNNEAFLLNLLSHRYFISSVHKDLMETLKTKTTNLLNLVKKEIED